MEPPKKAAPTKKDFQRRNMLRTREWLLRTFPKCFQPFGQPKLSLKIGIDENIVAIYGGGYRQFRYELAAALHDYTSGESYLRTMTTGAVRIDLDGNPAGEVVEDAAKIAALRLAKLES
jgi:ProP effector